MIRLERSHFEQAQTVFVAVFHCSSMNILHKQTRAKRSARRQRPGRHAMAGFTLVELLVVIVVIGILIAMLMPAVQYVRNSARSTHCKSNLRQISLAIDVYLDSQGTNGRYPDVAVLPTLTPERPSLADVLAPYIQDNRLIFHCPGDEEYFAREGLSYEYRNYKFAGKTRKQALQGSWSKKQKRSNSEYWMIYDYEAFHGEEEQEGARNALFADGHVDGL